MMTLSISREMIQTEFERLLEVIFSLPETVEVRVRHIAVNRQQTIQERKTAISKIMEVSYHDIFSDIDLMVVVKRLPDDEAGESHYMKRIDRYGMTSDKLLGIAFVPESRMYRIALNSGIRYDFGFEFIEDKGATPLADILTEDSFHAEMTSASDQESALSEDNPHWPVENVNRFWFVQIQALGKLYRDDYLIADHLANMNVNETLVQQMVLRDIRYGTNHHRYGYREELCYRAQLQSCPYKKENETVHEIAAKLYAAALAYDELTKKFYPEYQSRHEVFFAVWDAYEQSHCDDDYYNDSLSLRVPRD